MRTLMISYDLSNPRQNKHVLAHQIMGLGQSWARPLEHTWYVRTEESESQVERQLAALLQADDGLIIQAVEEDAVLTNTALRWFRQRRAGMEIGAETNIIAFPVPRQFPEQPELPLATAC